jgi:hypothetical protein
MALPVSVVSAYFALQRLQVKLHPKYTALPRCTTNMIYVDLKNTSFLPIFHLSVEFGEENIFLGKSRCFLHRHYHLFKFFGKCHVKKTREENTVRNRHVLLFPKETFLLAHTIQKEDCGVVRVQLKQLCLCDYLGIVSFRRTEDIHCAVTYLPLSYEQTQADFGLSKSIDRLLRETQKRGADNPELLQIREYIPGDKINHIHWKLSGKYDHLMVKEFEKEEGGRIYLAIELFNEEKNGKNSINELLDYAYNLILAFLNLHYQVTVGWYSTHEHSFCSKIIQSEDMAKQTFAELLNCCTYSDSKLLSTVLPTGSHYTIIQQLPE